MYWEMVVSGCGGGQRNWSYLVSSSMNRFSHEMDSLAVVVSVSWLVVAGAAQLQEGLARDCSAASCRTAASGRWSARSRRSVRPRPASAPAARPALRGVPASEWDRRLQRRTLDRCRQRGAATHRVAHHAEPVAVHAGAHAAGVGQVVECGQQLVGTGVGEVQRAAGVDREHHEPLGGQPRAEPRDGELGLGEPRRDGHGAERALAGVGREVDRPATEAVLPRHGRLRDRERATLAASILCGVGSGPRSNGLSAATAAVAPMVAPTSPTISASVASMASCHFLRVLWSFSARARGFPLNDFGNTTAESRLLDGNHAVTAVSTTLRGTVTSVSETAASLLS